MHRTKEGLDREYSSDSASKRAEVLHTTSVVLLINNIMQASSEESVRRQAAGAIKGSRLL